MTTLADELRERDQTLAEQLHQRDYVEALQQLDKLKPVLLAIKPTTPGKLTVHWSVDFPRDRFSVDNGGLGTSFRALKEWTDKQGFKELTAAHKHSCNWRECCDEAGCDLNTGVIFHY